MLNFDMCLITCLHDPDGKIGWEAMSKFPYGIRDLYTEVVMEVTPETYENLPDVVRQWTYSASAESLGEVRRRILRRGLETNCDFFHFVDFDRLLFWYMNFTEEIRHVICNFKTKNFVVIGRTKPALDSHPWLQKETEEICNSLASEVLGSDIDFLAASRIIPRKIAAEIAGKSIENNPACIDLEWPLLAGLVDYVEVNGLGYESGLLRIEKSWEEEIKTRIDNLSALTEMVLRERELPEW